MAFEGIAPLTEAEAVEALAADPRPDPTGTATPESMAATGPAFELRAGGGKGVFVVTKKGTRLWIEAGVGKADDDLTRMGLEVIEEMARSAGCEHVGFQTARRGLVKKAEQAGYQVAGWILEKKV